MPDEYPTQSKRIRFDPTVNAGHILTFAGMLVALFMGWTSLDKRVVVLEENRATQRQVDLHQNDMQRAEMGQIRESLSEIKRSVERVNDQLTLRQSAPVTPRPPSPIDRHWLAASACLSGHQQGRAKAQSTVTRRLLKGHAMKLFTDIKGWFKEKFILIDNWRAVLKKSLTVWFAIGAAFFGAVEFWHEDFLALLPIAAPFLPEKAAGAISTLLTAAIPFARIKKQVSLAIEEAKLKAAKEAEQGRS